MSKRNQWLLGIAGVVVVAVLAYFGTMALGLGEYDGAPIDEVADAGGPTDEERETEAGERLCAAQTAVDSVRQTVFDRARDAARGEPEPLVRLERDSLARIEDPRLERYDADAERATCTGRFVLQLPPGTESAFSDSRRLTASIDYVAEPGPGGAVVSRLFGADMVIDRLASADLEPDEFEDKPLEEGFGELPPEEPGPGKDEEPIDLLPPVMEGPAPKS